MENRREVFQTLLAGAFALAPATAAAPAGGVRMIDRQLLPAPFTGMDAAFVEVTLAPGAGSTAHHHSGMVLGYVIEGEFSFGLEGQPPKTLKAGDIFYEPPGALHSTGESAHPSKPAKILAIVIGPKGQPVTK